MASRLEDLPQDFLGDSGVKSSDVEGPLVGLRGGATRSSAGGRAEAVLTHVHTTHVHGSWHWARVLGNAQRWWHVGAVVRLLSLGQTTCGLGRKLVLGL